MFTYKTDAELQAMTAEQRDAYAREKREHEAKEAKKAIDETVKTAKESMEKDFKEKSNSQEKEITDLKEIVKQQGVKIVELSTKEGASKKDTLENIFKEAYDKVVSGEEHTVKDSIRIDTSKATVSNDVMSAGAVSAGDFPAAGSTQIVSSSMQTLFGKLIGYFGFRNPTSKILDLIDIQPMDNATLIAINESVIGDAAVTPECQLKPNVKMGFEVQEKSADPIAVEWCTTTKLRRFFPALVNRMLQKFTELVNDKLPNVVLDYVKANATAFTPIPELAINSNPNNYDALGAVVATVENLGKIPNAIILNPVAWRNMKQEKTPDGVYTMSNGQSISILQNGLDWGGTFIQLIKDPKIGIDEFLIGDFYGSVKAGVDTQLMYFETDGRTDQNASNSLTGLSRNIRTHVLEKFFAIIIPNGAKVGLIKDTFSNVKTLITAEEMP